MEAHVLWVCPPVFTSPRRSAGHRPASGKPSSSRPNQHDRLLERHPAPEAPQMSSSQGQPGQLLQPPAFCQKVLGATITS